MNKFSIQIGIIWTSKTNITKIFSILREKFRVKILKIWSKTYFGETINEIWYG